MHFFFSFFFFPDIQKNWFYNCLTIILSPVFFRVTGLRLTENGSTFPYNSKRPPRFRAAAFYICWNLLVGCLTAAARYLPVHLTSKTLPVPSCRTGSSVGIAGNDNTICRIAGMYHLPVSNINGYMSDATAITVEQ